MELVYYVVVIKIILISCFIFYHLGYKKGAKRILKEWKEFNSEYFGKKDECPHGQDWDDCPDCMH